LPAPTLSPRTPSPVTDPVSNEDIHALDVTGNNLARAGDAELLEEEQQLLLERVADRLSRSFGQVPELLLEGTDRVFARLVEELALGLARLPLGAALVKDPPLHLAFQRKGKRRMLERH